MKRDMEIIRTVLLKVEEKCPPYGNERFSKDDFPGYDWMTVWSHARLLEDIGFFQGVSHEVGIDCFSVHGLSWEGHEFLESIRDPETWRKIKEIAQDLKNFGIGTIKTISRIDLKQKIKAKLEIKAEQVV